MFWKINYTFDTGVSWEKGVCIIFANSKEDAKAKFRKWYIPKLRSDEWIDIDKAKVTQIEVSEDNCVLYQNTFKEKEE